MDIKRIAIDVDGVLVNTHEILVEVYNRRYNKNITIDDLDHWNYFSDKVFKKIYTETCKRSNEYKLLDSFAHYYMFLFNYKYDVDVLTHQWNGVKKIENFLCRLGVVKGIAYNNIIKAKGKKAEYDYNVFVDDNPMMSEDILDYPEKYLLLYESSSNKYLNCDEYRNVFRVRNFSDVAEKIEQLEKV